MGALLWRGSKTLGLVLFYYCFSVGLTFYNKRILTDYPFPLSITLIHLLLKFLIALLVRKATSAFKKTPSVSLEWKPYLKNITPMGIFSSLDIGLSNWSLVFITVSLYTMSKSSALIFILFFAILFKLEQPRLIQVGVVLFIVAGLVMFTYESTSFNLEGFLLVMAASIVTGLRWSIAQVTIQKEELRLSNPVDTVYHLQPVMTLTLLPLAFFIDGVHLGTSRQIFLASELFEVVSTGVYISAGALLAFMLGVSEYLLVYHTSSLTLSISGVVKLFVQLLNPVWEEYLLIVEILILTISTTAIEESTLSPLNVGGMVICIMGVTIHSVAKAHRARVETKPPETDFAEDRETLLSPSKMKARDSDASDSEDSVVLYETRL